MAISRSTMTFLSVVHWLGGLGLTIFFTYQFVNSGRTMLGALFFIIAVTNLVYFYFKWFWMDRTFALSDWPPYRTACPDFMTMLEPPGSAGPGSAGKCVDFVGVSYHNILKRSDPGNPPDESDPAYRDFIFSVSPRQRDKEKATSALARNLAWQGYTDGILAPL